MIEPRFFGNPEAGMAEFNPVALCALMYMPGASSVHRLRMFLYELFMRGLR